MLLVILSHFSSPNFCQNSKLRVSEILKMVIFEVQILPKLISCKIKCQINSCIVDLNFNFLKFLEHGANVDLMWTFRGHFCSSFLPLLPSMCICFILFSKGKHKLPMKEIQEKILKGRTMPISASNWEDFLPEEAQGKPVFTGLLGMPDFRCCEHSRSLSVTTITKKKHLFYTLHCT